LKEVMIFLLMRPGLQAEFISISLESMIMYQPRK
jgi:hypothetical protein